MQLISAPEISGKIMSLIAEAREKLVIISPYYQVESWTKLRNYLERAQHRNINIEFYVREDADRSIKEIKKIGYEPLLVHRLHSKIYLNERYGIVSSMNLYESSDVGSIDIGYKT